MLVGLLVGPGCIHIGPPSLPPVQNVVEESTLAGRSVVRVKVGWLPMGTQQVKILVSVYNPGLVKTDSLRLRMSSNGVVYSEGTPTWTSLLLPRFESFTEVTYSMPVGVVAGQVVVELEHMRRKTVVSRSVLRFSRGARTVELVGV